MQKTQSTVEACASLIQEHRQMESMLENLKRALTELQSKQGLDAVQAIMGKIALEMNTHFACEEKVLFPAVTPYHPMVLMEAEHEELIALRDGILTLFSSEEAQTSAALIRLQETGNRFISDMLDHIGREDAGIFPTCERALSDDEKEAVIAGMAEIRKQALQIPTPSITRPERTFQAYQPNLAGEPQREIMSQRIFEDTTLEAKHITLQAGKSLAAHWTPKQSVLICLQGEGIFTANEKDQPLLPGTIITMSPQLQHAITAKTRCDILLLLRNDAI